MPIFAKALLSGIVIGAICSGIAYLFGADAALFSVVAGATTLMGFAVSLLAMILVGTTAALQGKEK